MRNRVKASLLTGICVFNGILNAADYYVATNGNNNNSGIISSPWATVKYGVGRLAPGDTLYIRGGTYRETYIDTFTAGTGDASRITVKACNNEKVIISSMTDAGGTGNWTQIGTGNVYSYNGALATTYRNVSVNGKPLQLMVPYNNFSGSSTDIAGAGQWSRNQTDAKLWVYATGGGNPGLQTIEISNTSHTVYLQKTLQYITLEGLTIEGGYYPIEIEASHVTIKNCTFRNSYGDAVKVGGWTEIMNPPEWNSAYGVIDNCDIYYFGESGIDITGGDYWQVNHTMIHDGIKNRECNDSQKLNGIMMKNNSVGTVVDGCRIFNLDARFGAITLGGSSDGSTRAEGVELTAKNNIIHDIISPYIIPFTGAENCMLLNNVIYNCNTTASGIAGASEALIEMRCSDAAGINQLRSSGVTVLSNIFYNNTTTYIYKESVDGNDIGAVIDYNFTDSTRNSFFDGISMTFNTMVTQKGYDAYSLTATPDFINYTERLLRLTPDCEGAVHGCSSPDATDDYNGQLRNSPVSLGAYERLSSTVYSDGSTTANWVPPSGKSVTTVFDAGIASDVIQTEGTALDYTTLFAAGGNTWNNNKAFIIAWKAKSPIVHAFQIRYYTKATPSVAKNIKFYSEYTSAGPHTSTLYRFPLGAGSASTQDGNWHNYVFNLTDFVHQVDSTEEIDHIDRFYVWGGCAVDDVELHNNINAAKMPKGLIGEWRLNEGAGSYTEDTSGLGRHGTLVNMNLADPANPCWIQGSDLKALKFDKSAQKYVSVPAVTEPFTKGFTIDATVRFDNLDSSYDVIAAGLQGNGVYGRLYEQSGFVYLQIRVDNNILLYAVTQSGRINTPGQWYRITGRCDMVNHTIRIFVDGADATDLTRYNYSFSGTSLNTGTGIMYIGNSATAGHAFEGGIDNVRLFNRPLTDSEIAAIGSLK
ncbi:MAG: LamG-like jellyroll fold domain-containing protein [Victivallaceae bacterium]|jgi:hypothetical protein